MRTTRVPGAGAERAGRGSLPLSRPRDLPAVRTDNLSPGSAGPGIPCQESCGGGRDAARIRERGFTVDATDAVPALVTRANQAFDLGARVMPFHELDAEAAYAGVWAQACLLHAPRAALPDVLARIHRALRAGGWHFASYKLGDAEGRDLLGGLHNFPPAEWLVAAYEAAGFAITAQETYAGKASDGTQRDWIDHARAAEVPHAHRPLDAEVSGRVRDAVPLVLGARAVTAHEPLDARPVDLHPP